MTTFRHPRGKTFRYDFWWDGRRHTGTTGQLSKQDADIVEGKIMERVRQDAHGIAPFDRTQTPSFSSWAFEHLKYVRKKGRVRRLDVVQDTLRLVLQFFGKRPATLPDPTKAKPQWRKSVAAARARAESAPYHDLRLADPITHPDWIERFEDWMTSLTLSGPRKNHYRSAMSMMYRTALLPAFRAKTKVSVNPFRDIERDVVPERDAVLTVEQLRAWIAAAAPHARLAMAIAVYAPELRLESILDLQWKVHLNPELTRIVVKRHKTAAATQRPQIIPVSPELHEILTWARKTHPRRKYVVAYFGERVHRLETTLSAAATRASATLPKAHRFHYGVKRGVTFHSIRHSMATMLAEWGEGDAVRQLVMGHLSPATTKKYTHLAALAKTAPLERLGSKVQLVDAVQGKVQDHAAKTRANPNKSGAQLRA